MHVQFPERCIQSEDASKLLTLENMRFLTAAKLGKAIAEKIDLKGREDLLPRISSSFISKGVPARLMTFIFSLLIAVFSAFFIPRKE